VRTDWNWDVDGVPTGLTLEDKSNYDVYKISPRVEYLLTVNVDRMTLTTEVRQYYNQAGFFKEEIKARSVPGVFETLDVPDGAFLFNTKGFVIPTSSTITITVSLFLEYVGPTTLSILPKGT
jgi:hypothetical protein